NAQRVAVVPLTAGWNDVGSWDALGTILPVDDDGNCVVGGATILLDSKDNIVSGGDRLIALIGVEDLIVVDTGDALLIGHKNKMQQVKQVVDTLHNQERSDLL